MTELVIREARCVTRTDAVQRLVTPGVVPAVIGIARLGLAAVLVGLALAGLATTGAFLAGPVPDLGPQPGF
jgi:hypothetical protein